MAIQNNTNSTIINITLSASVSERMGLSGDYDYDYDSLNDDSDIDNNGSCNNGGSGSAIDKQSFLNWIKSLVKNLLGDSGNTGNGLPSNADAARTIREFQKENKTGLLSSDQCKQMADTGYATLPGGQTIQVPPDVQAAAQKMMVNNGDLFKKLESAIRGSHDGLLSQEDYDAALKDGSIGKPGTADLPMMRGLDPKAFLKFVMDGILSPNLPTEYNAAKTIHDFQKEFKTGLLSSVQCKHMADTGYCPLPGGDIQVKPDVQGAAQKMMANNGDLFKKLESAIRGSHDGLLSQEDYDAAVKDGSIGQQGSTNGSGIPNSLTRNVSTGGNNLPSETDASKANGANGASNTSPSSPNNNTPVEKTEHGAIDTMWKFQKDVMGKEMLNREKVQQMADTGKLTKDNGVTMEVPKDVQDSAKRMMANNGALFDKVEVAHNGKKDGLIAEADFKPAWKQSVKGTTNTIIDFQKSELKGDFLTRAHMKEMAEKGTITKNDGSVVQVPPHVQQAARSYMDNDAKLFKEVESWQNNKHDDKLSIKDAEIRNFRLDHGKSHAALAALPIPLPGRIAAATS